MIPLVTKPRRRSTTLAPLTIALGLMSAVGCDEEGPTPEDAGTDAGVSMADAGDDAGGPPGTDGGLDASVDAGLADAGGTDAGSDAGMACGTDTVPLSMIRGTEGIAIAPDGTVYYSQSGALGRRVPGGAAEDA